MATSSLHLLMGEGYVSTSWSWAQSYDLFWLTECWSIGHKQKIEDCRLRIPLSLWLLANLPVAMGRSPSQPAGWRPVTLIIQASSEHQPAAAWVKPPWTCWAPADPPVDWRTYKLTCVSQQSNYCFGGKEKRAKAGQMVMEGDSTWGDTHTTYIWCVIECTPETCIISLTNINKFNEER